MKFSTFHVRTLLAAVAFVGSNISTCDAQEQVTCSSSSATPDEIMLESFSDPSYNWGVQNDPVMGGQSDSSMELMMEAEEGTVAYFAGEVKDVPYLGVPGFIKTQSTGRKPYPDVSCCESLKLTVRGMEDYAGYRVSFGTKRATTSFFASGFKANFDAPLGEYGDVIIPFDMFSVEWDGATGDQTITCAEDPTVCPDRDTLENMETIALWGEGVGGTLNLYVKAISAVGCASSSSASSTTTGDVPNRSSEKDIPAVAMENGAFTTLVAALSATDLVSAISSPEGPFTVFAPTDEAFDALPNGLVECLLQDDNLPLLSNILLYHVASGEALSTDLMNGMRIPTLLPGEEVTVDLTNNDGVKINDATVVGADVLASNGVIHVINQVLVPPSVDVGTFLQTCSNSGASSSSPSLVDIPTTAINAGIFSTLVAALSATDLVGALSEPNGPLTVFAPHDDAFNTLPNGLVSCLLEEKNLPILSEILLYHVASGTALSNDLSNEQKISTLLEGAKVTVDLTNGVKINGSNVVGADVLASNGVIHIIDAVLVPPQIDVAAFLQTCPGNGNGNGNSNGNSPSVPSPSQNNNDEATDAADDVKRSDKDIPGVASENGSFTTLVAALSATDLVGALSSPAGPFTVFAPNDDAFEALPNGLVECLLQEQNLPVLSNILLYHVAAGETLSTELSTGMEIPTLLAQQAVTVDLSNNGVKINDSTVVGADVLASNGVIHVLNQVLVPPSVDVGAFLETCDTAASSAASSLPDIPTTAINAGIFTTLVAALSATDIVGALSEPNGPYTVFAPNDDAFTALPNGLVSCLLEEKNLPILSDILFYHVASGQTLSTELSNNQQIPTLLDGAKVTVDLRNNGVKINDSTVISADVLASNGVIHIIDAVLVPPRINVDAFLQTCGGGSSSSSSSGGGYQSVQPLPGHNNDTCTYLGVQRSAGQYLVGPTHTCLCTYGGAWTQCRLNHL